jgi:imidazolonepropionase-like amidohydrolase
VRDLVRIGIDSVEHGTALDDETLGLMAERGIAWTPTLSAFSTPLPDDASEVSRKRRSEYLESLRATVPTGSRLGVTILAGSDIAGSIVDEVRRLIEFGLGPVEALAAATTAARVFLDAPGIEEDASADVLTFEEDPRDDPAALGRPAAILHRGRRVR